MLLSTDKKEKTTKTQQSTPGPTRLKMAKVVITRLL
jgi:hypothetical protein